jgi:hypothetical protein
MSCGALWQHWMPSWQDPSRVSKSSLHRWGMAPGAYQCNRHHKYTCSMCVVAMAAANCVTCKMVLLIS